LQTISKATATGPVELYIVGDLFEFWYEYARNSSKSTHAILRRSKPAWTAGVKIFLFFGNRDFAYGDYVLKRFGATVLGDGQDITLGDHRRAWLEHGDLLCTADTRYLKFRKRIRSPPRALALPPDAVEHGEKNDRPHPDKNRRDKNKKSAAAFGIDLEAARKRLDENRCQVLSAATLTATSSKTSEPEQS